MALASKVAALTWGIGWQYFVVASWTNWPTTDIWLLDLPGIEVGFGWMEKNGMEFLCFLKKDVGCETPLTLNMHLRQIRRFFHLLKWRFLWKIIFRFCMVKFSKCTPLQKIGSGNQRTDRGVRSPSRDAFWALTPRKVSLGKWLCLIPVIGGVVAGMKWTQEVGEDRFLEQSSAIFLVNPVSKNQKQNIYLI